MADAINRDPFPPLQWSERFDWWEGTVSLPSLIRCHVKWAWSQDSFFPSSSADRTLRSSVSLHVYGKQGHGPDAHQCAAMQYLLNNEAAIAALLLDALKAELSRDLPDLIDNHGWQGKEIAARDRFLETVTRGDGIREIVSPACVIFYRRRLAGCSYTGFCFEKGWDWEHSSLVIMHKDRVVDCGETGALYDFDQNEKYENEGEPVFDDSGL